jgi:hypothetical protein
MIRSRRGQSPWVVIVEPDVEASLLVVVTVYEVSNDGALAAGDLSQGPDICGVPAPLASNWGEEREDCGITGWPAHCRLRRVRPTVGRRDHGAAGGAT